MKQIKISIATVVYNGGSTLSQAIESVINQRYSDIEYLIIDGASKDNTLNIAEYYASQYDFIKIKSEPDAGIYDAMNKAQRFATGDFLIFLGSDDIFYNENVIDDFAKSVTDVSSVYYGDVIAKITNEQWYGTFSTEKIIMQNISHQAIFYPKNIYKQFTYNLRYKLFADWDYNLRVWSRYGPFSRIELIVAVYAQNGASSNYNYDPVFLADRARLVTQYFGSKYGWLVEMQKMKQRLIGKTDLRKIKGYIFPKLK